jgi:glycosyltransferase involved in cell wall biosynthesis
MKISVIITSYNQKDYLGQAIESVLNQTLLPYEIIVGDDCSTDGSQDLIKHYHEQYPNLIRAFCHKENLGIPKNRNFALRKVRGDFVTILDGDDTFLPRKLELELDTFKKHPGASVVFSNFYYTDKLGRPIRLWARQGTSPTGYVLKESFSRSWPHGGLYRNELLHFHALEQVGFYDENLPLYEDWDFKIRCASKLKVAYCPVPLAEHRLHPAGISKTTARDFHLSMMKRVYEKNRHLLGNLSESDQREVGRKLSGIFSRLEFSIALKNGQRGTALRKYLSHLKETRKNPLKLRNLATLLRILLPDGAYRAIATIYTRMRRARVF